MMHSRGFHEALAVLRGRTWTEEEATLLTLLIKNGITHFKENKMTTTHILVRSIDDTPSIIYFSSAADVKKWSEEWPEVLSEPTAKSYTVDEIKPTRKVIIDVSL